MFLKTIKSTLVAAALALTAGPALAATVTLQAESVGSGSAAVFENIHGGYTGTGYVNSPNTTGTELWFFRDSNIEPAVTATFKVRYANGATTSRPANFTVNNEVYWLQFPPTGGWNVWAEVTVAATLLWDMNEIVLTSLSANGLANIDRLTITTP